MPEFRRLARTAGVAVSGTLSVVLGVLVAERLVRPEVIQEIRTPVLLGLVLLFVLPALTYFAVRQDERASARDDAARESALRRFADRTVPAAAAREQEPISKPAAKDDSRAVRHAPGDRLTPARPARPPSRPAVSRD